MRYSQLKQQASRAAWQVAMGDATWEQLGAAPLTTAYAAVRHGDADDEAYMRHLIDFYFHGLFTFRSPKEMLGCEPSAPYAELMRGISKNKPDWLLRALEAPPPLLELEMLLPDATVTGGAAPADEAAGGGRTSRSQAAAAAAASSSSSSAAASASRPPQPPQPQPPPPLPRCPSHQSPRSRLWPPPPQQWQQQHRLCGQRPRRRQRARRRA